MICGIIDIIRIYFKLMIYILIYYIIIIIFLIFVIFLYFLINQIIIYIEIELIKISSIKVELLFLFDWVSILFVRGVLIISMIVIFYRIEYMRDDLNIYRFILIVFIFVVSILLIILRPNLIRILLGWDGLGLVSYCLVIYYQSKNRFNSGIITVLTNRLGDILFLICIRLIISIGSFNYIFIYKLRNLIYFMLIIASFTKRAQIPFSS